MTLTQILQPDCVKVPVDSKTKEAVITELVDLLDAAGLLSDRDVALQAVLTREQTRSTGTGAGIAIPHGKCNDVCRSLSVEVFLIEDRDLRVIHEEDGNFAFRTVQGV